MWGYQAATHTKRKHDVFDEHQDVPVWCIMRDREKAQHTANLELGRLIHQSWTCPLAACNISPKITQTCPSQW